MIKLMNGNIEIRCIGFTFKKGEVWNKWRRSEGSDAAFTPSEVKWIKDKLKYWSEREAGTRLWTDKHQRLDKRKIRISALRETPHFQTNAEKMLILSRVCVRGNGCSYVIFLKLLCFEAVFPSGFYTSANARAVHGLIKDCIERFPSLNGKMEPLI